MIVSHRHRFIYVKTHKTGSTAVEVALAPFLGPDDILTPAKAEFQAMRGEAGPRNYRLNHPLVPKVPLLKRLLGRPVRQNHPSVGFYHHMPAWRIRAYVGEEVWRDYFKFTFERNPWDRQVSWYWFKSVRPQKGRSFEAFMRNRRRAYVPNFDLYSQNDKVVVDFVGRYEQMQDDWLKVLRNIGLDESTALPLANVSERRRDYREVYNERTKAIVGDWYSREISLLCYSF
jgi:hypothetical protein